MARSQVGRAAGFILLLASLARPAAPAAATARARAEAPDLAAARALFERNLDAIRHRDRPGYLACYLDSPALVVTGPVGFKLGYEPLANARDSDWPDAFEGLDLRLTPVHPGLVYATYRYRVRYGADEQSGLSERLFVETPEGWRIALTTAFPAAGVPAPPLPGGGGTPLDGN